MKFAKIAEVTAGDVLVADDGFTCIAAGTELVVMDKGDGLFVACDYGRHYLDGQVEGDHYVGLTRAA